MLQAVEAQTLAHIQNEQYLFHCISLKHFLLNEDNIIYYTSHI